MTLGRSRKYPSEGLFDEVCVKTFSDLQFKPHPNGGGGIQARLDFDNDYGVSVIQTQYSYTSNDSEFELGVFHNGRLTYDTPITDDVVGHVTAEEITAIMKEIQSFEKKGEPNVSKSS